MRVLSIFFVILLTFLFDPVPSHADAPTKQTTPSIADAVYADLALRNELQNVSVFMFDDKNVNTVAINEKKQWIPASTVKTFVAMYAYNQIEKGNIHLTDTVHIEGKNVVSTELVTDEFPTLYEGEFVTLDRLIRQMVTQSDNTAYNTLLDLLDRRAVTTYIQSLGLSHTSIGSKLNLDDTQNQYENTVPGVGINTTTARDYAYAFSLINTGKVSGAKELFTILSQQKINNMIPLFLPKTTAIAHKTGDWDPLYHDGGIIIPTATKKPYILAIFTNTGDPNIVAHISQIVYTKDFQLVGRVLAASDETPGFQPLDPLLFHLPFPTPTPTPRPNVLGLSSFVMQNITASDLGITAKDLSLSSDESQLPQVLIPADSPFHALVTLWYATKEFVTISPKAGIHIEAERLSLRVAEANTLLADGKNESANAILSQVQGTLASLVKEPTVSSDAALQTALERVSQERFTVLGSELTHENGQERLSLISTIAHQAKTTSTTIDSQLPQAATVTNLQQRPLIGTVVKSDTTTLIVKTPGGQQVTIPLSQPDLKIRSENQPQASSAASMQQGTTVALVGTLEGSTFSPTFILANVPHEIVAPQPVTILKVNTKNQSIVVSDNGIPMQVDLTKQTVIKAGETNVSLNSLKAGDIIVVSGHEVPSASPSAIPTIPPLPTPTPTPIRSGQTSIPPLVSNHLPASGAGSSGATGSSSSVTVFLSPTGKQQPTTPLPTTKLSPMSEKHISEPPTQHTTAGGTPMPKVIVGNSIQVIQTTQQQKADQTLQQPTKAGTNQSAPSTPLHPANTPTQSQNHPTAIPPTIAPTKSDKHK